MPYIYNFATPYNSDLVIHNALELCLALYGEEDLKGTDQEDIPTTVEKHFASTTGLYLDFIRGGVILTTYSRLYKNTSSHMSYPFKFFQFCTAIARLKWESEEYDMTYPIMKHHVRDTYEIDQLLYYGRQVVDNFPVVEDVGGRKVGKLLRGLANLGISRPNEFQAWAIEQTGIDPYAGEDDECSAG